MTGDQAAMSVQAARAAALTALHQGRSREALARLTELTRELTDDPTLWVALAKAALDLRQCAQGLAAADRALALAPADLVALLIKAQLLDVDGQARAAVGHYRQALVRAAQRSEIEPQLIAPLEQAQQRIAGYQKAFEASLVDWMRQQGLPSQGRFAESIELLTGRKQLYLQQPKVYYFPGLAQIQFYDREVFPWMPGLEASTVAIREELLAVMQDGAGFEPYVQDTPGRPPRTDSPLVGNTDWSAYSLYKDGRPVVEHLARCPRTIAAVQQAPLSDLPGRSPTVMFSSLRGGTHIPPHCGLINTRLIVHLPLIVPRDCGLRVGNDTRRVEAGKAWAFDDTIEHEAWNRSDQTRVILLFEIWRPELSEAEREQVRMLFAALDRLGSLPEVWSV